MYSVFNCHNVAQNIEFYLGCLRFNVISNGNAGCFKNSFTMVLLMLLSGECFENIQHLERWTVCTPLNVNIFLTLATQ
jgi:hypothetical protein